MARPLAERSSLQSSSVVERKTSHRTSRSGQAGLGGAQPLHGEAHPSVDSSDDKTIFLGQDVQGRLRLVGRDQRGSDRMERTKDDTAVTVRFADANGQRTGVALDRNKSKSITLLQGRISPQRGSPMVARRGFTDKTHPQPTAVPTENIVDAAAAVIRRQQEQLPAKKMLDSIRGESMTRAERQPLIMSSDPEKWKSFVGHQPEGLPDGDGDGPDEFAGDTDGWLV